MRHYSNFVDQTVLKQRESGTMCFVQLAVTKIFYWEDVDAESIGDLAWALA